MRNAVWIYLRPGFSPPQNVEEFLEWADDHDVKVVLLHFNGTTYADQPVVEPHLQTFIDGCVDHKLRVHGMFNALTSVPEEWIDEQHKDLFCVDYHEQTRCSRACKED